MDIDADGHSWGTSAAFGVRNVTGQEFAECCHASVRNVGSGTRKKSPKRKPTDMHQTERARREQQVLCGYRDSMADVAGGNALAFNEPCNCLGATHAVCGENDLPGGDYFVLRCSVCNRTWEVTR